MWACGGESEGEGTVWTLKQSKKYDEIVDHVNLNLGNCSIIVSWENEEEFKICRTSV